MNVSKTIYAGKLIGQMEAKRAEADKLVTLIYEMAHRLQTIQQDIQWNSAQLKLHAEDIIGNAEMSKADSLMRATNKHSQLADKILGKVE